MSIDPVTTDANTGGSFNRYAYANNSPYKYTDPDGRLAFLAGAVPYVLTATVIVVGHYALPGRQGREDTARLVGNAIKNAISSSSSSPITTGTNIGGKGDKLVPGPHAGESIPARGPGRDFTQDERKQINQIGQDTGCHTCGNTDPGTTSGNHIPDHQPPSALNPSGGPQVLLPHCKPCSNSQGGQVSGVVRGEKKAEEAKAEETQTR